MSIELKAAEERSILKVRVGSHLYGTNTPTSDEDFVGIFIPTADYFLGIKREHSDEKWNDEVTANVVSKDALGKNTAEAIDCKFFTLEKFARLALDNNPNIIEILFVNLANVLYMTNDGGRLLDLKKSFLSKHVKGRFLEYANSQKHKMVIKLENYEALVEASNYLGKCDKRYILENDMTPFTVDTDHISIGDIKMPLTITVKKAKSIIDRRLSKFGSRQELVAKYGWDTKFGSHLIRLIVEGIELLSTGGLIFPLKEAKLLTDIKLGEYSMEEVLKMAEEYEKEIESVYASTTLPDSSDFEIVQNFVVNAHLAGIFK